MKKSPEKEGLQPYLPSRRPSLQKGFEKCVYDWTGKGKWKLDCVTHKGRHVGIIVLNRFGEGAQTLKDLLGEEMLAGEALADAKLLLEEEQFLGSF